MLSVPSLLFFHNFEWHLKICGHQRYGPEVYTHFLKQIKINESAMSLIFFFFFFLKIKFYVYIWFICYLNMPSFVNKANYIETIGVHMFMYMLIYFKEKIECFLIMSTKVHEIFYQMVKKDIILFSKCIFENN